MSIFDLRSMKWHLIVRENGSLVVNPGGIFVGKRGFIHVMGNPVQCVVVFACSMACYSPMTAWYAKELNGSGKRSLVFDAKGALEPDRPIEIACGQCIGCRLERSRQWAIRCVHEASLHEYNCFITLTFDDEHLLQRDNPWSLDVRDFQLFMKKFRKNSGARIRFFHCGEYGDRGKRPHYHACIFGYDFPDKVLWKVVNDQKLYVSAFLQELWPYGFSTIGNVTFESAAYVARYVMKKINGSIAEEHYQWADADTGEVYPLKPEYTTMSRRPGIGAGWFDKYGSEVYPSDSVVINGREIRPPKYYDGLLEKNRPFEFDELKEARYFRGLESAENNTEERLNIRHQIQLNRLGRLPRNLED